uniref:Uncharacterized protein n=1 Tax=Trichogramma kaykai TaxID=54128 RepID=A0ABD2X0C0_9HYME
MKCEQRCRQLVGLEVDTNEWLSDFVNRRGEQRRELAGNFPERYEDLRETQEEAAKYFNDLQERRIAHEAALRNAEQQSESYADTRLKRRDCPAAAFHYHFKKQGVESRAAYVSQLEVSRNYLAEASEAERRALIEEQYPGFADFINRRNSLNEVQSGETSQSDAHSDSESRDEPQDDAKYSVSVDELATMFSNTNFNTSPMVALSTTRADEVLVDIHNSDYGPIDNQSTENRSDTAA